MKAWTPEETDPEFEMTPMIDVVFLLIAFFMTLISFISSELIKLELPEAEEATIPEDPGDRQYISINDKGEAHWGAKPISYEALTVKLEELRKKNPRAKVYLRADANASHRPVNKVMTACAKAQIFDVIFANNKD
ncbi:MAG: biopolymer transport protein ExbD [Lentimonas sp.]|jgi:biopolymer transport protein ExbD